MKPILRYSHPAREFKNGLPIGNGRLAAMICGDEKEIRLALNHEWLWKGENRFRDCEDVAAHLPEVRDALFAGDFKTGTQLANDYFAGLGGISGVKNRVDPYQPAGDFTVTAEGEGAYQRTLDLSSGETVIRSGKQNSVPLPVLQTDSLSSRQAVPHPSGCRVRMIRRAKQPSV